MVVPDLPKRIRRITKLLREKPQGKRGSLYPVVWDILKKRTALMALATKHQTPFFVLDEEALEEALTTFHATFRILPWHQPYYAVKANHHPRILEAAVEKGYGLDVSSKRELQLALEAGAEKIVFSGPGKTADDHALALKHADRVIIHLDSFGELRRLGALTSRRKQSIRVGVRVYAPLHGSWSKFGIPIGSLTAFWREAQKFPSLSLEGIQSHISWNTNPKRYEELIATLGKTLRNSPPELRAALRFIDLGGGFYPDGTEGYYPWTAHYPGTLPVGKILKIADDHFGEKTPFRDRYFVTQAVSLSQFARRIRSAIRQHLSPLVDCATFTEPGRIICTKAMHIVLRAVDRKDDRHVIMDGGVNMVGWEYGEHFYVPIVNLTQPSRREKPLTLFGPLCTPHDIWGYSCYGNDIREGDVVIVPYQGAYRFALAQAFIKDLPSVHILPRH